MQNDCRTARNPADLELAFVNLNRKVEVLTPLDAEILELTPDDDIEAEIDHADQYQEGIRRTLSKLSNALAVVAPTPRTDPAARVDPTPTALRTEGPHVRRPRLCCLVPRPALRAVTVNSHTHPLNALSSLKCKLEEKPSSQADVASIAYAMVMLRENADHGTFANTARGNITLASQKDTGPHPCNTAPVMPALNPEAPPFGST